MTVEWLLENCPKYRNAFALNLPEIGKPELLVVDCTLDFDDWLLLLLMSMVGLVCRGFNQQQCCVLQSVAYCKMMALHCAHKEKFLPIV